MYLQTRAYVHNLLLLFCKIDYKIRFVQWKQQGLVQKPKSIEQTDVDLLILFSL